MKKTPNSAIENSDANELIRVIIADDDERLLTVVSRNLREKGIECVTKINGTTALKELRENPFDVALIDLDMPEIDGFQLLDIIQKEEIPVIPVVLTGTGNVANAVRAVKLGAFDFLQKPLDRQLLQQAVRHAFEYGKARTESEQMRALMEQWKSAFNASPNPVIAINLEGRITHCNQKTALLVARNPGELIGLNCHEALCSKRHPLQDCPFLKGSMENLMAPVEYDLWGGIYEVSSAPLKNSNDEIWGRFSVAHDLTERKRAEVVIHEREEMLRVMTGAAPNAILMMDEHGLISFYNPASERMFGWKPEEVIGKDLHRLLMPPQYQLAHEKNIEHFRQSGEGPAVGKTLELTALRKDGREFPMEISLSSVHMRGAWHAIGIIKDISNRKRMEDELHRVNLELEKRVEERTVELATTNTKLRLEEARLEALWQLSQSGTKTFQEITHYTLEEGVRLTGSTIGYLAFMNEDESILTMHAWSTTAMEQCAMIHKPIEYRIEDTGLWGETVRQRKPIITNDYAAASTLKRGTPEGHVCVTRHVNVPIFDGGRIVLVAGVGNKEQPYDEADVRQLELLFDGMWRIVRQKQSVEALIQVNRMLRVLSESNQAIVHLSEESELLQQVCRILVDYGGYPLVWIGYIKDDDDSVLYPVAQWGFKNPWYEPVSLKGADAENDAGVVGQVIRSGEPCLCKDIGLNQSLRPWFDETANNDEVQHIAIPLFLVENQVAGVLGISAIEQDAFRTTEVDLLRELSADLSYAITTLRTRKEYKATQEMIAKLSSLKEQLIGTLSLPEKLKLITDAIVDVFQADFARIWTIGDGDKCNQGCVHAEVTEGPLVCVDRSRCLHLIASSGRYTHLNGPHQRVPIGCYKIGRLASGDDPSFITNNAVHDSRVHNHKWAEELGLVSFAGWRLLSPEGKPMGVLALFSKHAINEAQGQLLEDLVNTTSHVLLTELATDALRESERKLLAILQGCPIPQFVIDRHHRVISWNKPLEKYTHITQEQMLGTNDQWRAFYTESRPGLADLLVDGAMNMIPQLYGDKCKPSSLLEEAYVGTDYFPHLGNGGSWLHFTAAPIHDARGNIIGAVETFEDITEQRRAEKEVQQARSELEKRVVERTLALTQSNTSLMCEVELRKLTEEELRNAHGEVERLFDSMSSFLIGLKQDLRISRWNAAAEITFGVSWAEAVGKRIDKCGIHWDWDAIVAQIPNWPTIAETIRLPDVRYTRPDGKEGFLGVTVDPVKGDSEIYEGCFLLGMDTSERRNLESQLVQALKLEAVGRLAAGIAHEINTPTQYVGDNIEFLQIAYESLLRLLTTLPAVVQAARKGTIPPELLSEAEDLVENTNIDYLTEQIPRAIDQSLEGVGRITTIVQSMKEFSHPGGAERTSVDLNQCIRSTVTVSRNEWKYMADLELELDSTLPLVLCFPGDFNQAILNMIVNAAHAISDILGENSAQKGRITISSRQDGVWAEVRIADTGAGIPDEIRERIFDPFFTTKEVGRGTGQGLAIARHIIVDKHSGTLEVESEVGKGTTFIIRLPIEGGESIDSSLPSSG